VRKSYETCLNFIDIEFYEALKIGKSWLELISAFWFMITLKIEHFLATADNNALDPDELSRLYQR
jgi:hypothetical protein